MKLLSRVRGRISIDVEPRAFTSGEFLSGDVQIRARRALVGGVLNLHVRCDETVQTWDGERRQHFEKVELFSGLVLTERDVDLAADETRRFPFTFHVPASHDGHAVDSLPGWGPAAGRIVKANAAWNSTVEWSLVARLHLGRIDLHAASPIVLFVR